PGYRVALPHPCLEGGVLEDGVAGAADGRGDTADVDCVPRAEGAGLPALSVELEIGDDVEAAACGRRPAGRGADERRVHVVDLLQEGAGWDIVGEASDETPFVH